MPVGRNAAAFHLRRDVARRPTGNSCLLAVIRRRSDHLARQPTLARSALTRGTRHHCGSKIWRQFLFTDARCRHDIAYCCYGFPFSQSLHCPPTAAADTLSCLFCGVRVFVCVGVYARVWLCVCVWICVALRVACCSIVYYMYCGSWRGAWGREDGGEI